MQGEKLYLQSYTIGGEKKPGPVIEFGEVVSGNVQAVFSNAVAKVEGSVEPPASALAVSLVWVEDAISRKSVDGGSEKVQGGRFMLDNLAPGRYRLFAIEGFDEDLWGSPELAAALREKSVAMELKESEQRIVTLPLISADEWLKALRKVGM